MGWRCGACSTAQAQWSSLWDSTYRDYHRNVDVARTLLAARPAATVAPFALKIANGWRRQNLMSRLSLPRRRRNQLNLAGETKLRWILTQQPPKRRTVFVQQGLTQRPEQARVGMVQRAADNVYGHRGTALVLERLAERWLAGRRHRCQSRDVECHPA